jgi:hypothetical protein
LTGVTFLRRKMTPGSISLGVTSLRYTEHGDFSTSLLLSAGGHAVIFKMVAVSLGVPLFIEKICIFGYLCANITI